MMLSAATAQSAQWLTGVADTSYTLHSEYRKLAAGYPMLQLPQALAKQPFRYERNIYAQANDFRLEAQVVAPVAEQNINGVVVVLIHGGGWRGGSPDLLLPLAERLAHRGYTCVLPQYRLSTHALYPAAVIDIQQCIRWVQQQVTKWNCSAKKIAVAGHSAGGQLAALIGAVNGQTLFSAPAVFVQAVIDMDGILAFIHPQSAEGDDTKRISAATRWFGAAANDRPDLWQQASALSHAGAHCPPYLFINSSVPRMQAGQNDFCAVLRKHGIVTEVVALSGAPHSFVLFQPWLDTIVDQSDRFLQHVFNGTTVKPATIFTAAFTSENLSQHNTSLHSFKPEYTCENKKPVCC